MDIRNILLFAAAADYTKNGRLTALEWAKDKVTGRSRGSRYDDPKMRNRVLRAQANAAEQKAARQAERAEMMASAYERLREFARSKMEGGETTSPSGSATSSGRIFVTVLSPTESPAPQHSAPCAVNSKNRCF